MAKTAETSTPKTKSTFVHDIKALAKLWPFLRQSKSWVIFGVIMIPLVSLVQMALPVILRHTIDDGIAQKNIDKVFIGGAAFLGAVVLEYLLRSGQSLGTAVAVHRMVRSMRRRLVEHVLRLPARFHDRSLSGTLVTRATGDFDNLSESLNLGVLTAVIDIAVLIGCVTGMMLLSMKLALVAIVIMPGVLWIVKWFSQGLKTAMLKTRRKIGLLNAYTQECLYGTATLKILTAEADATRKYQFLNKDFRDAQMQSVVLDAMMFAVLDGVASIAVGFVLWLIVHQYIPEAGLTVGILVAFVQYLQQLFEPLKQLGNKMAMLQGAFASVERIFGVLDTPDRIQGGQPLESLRGEIVVKNLSFTYGGAAQNSSEKASIANGSSNIGISQAPILTDINFRMEPGESLALVGPTGSGKSTIVKLLSKLYDGYTGTITLDGKNLCELDPQMLKRHIAVVPQDIVLFDGSIAFNISLGLPGISAADVEAAARVVRAHDFIEKLPGKYEFMVREQGANLSHGQRQLIAFARALARQPQLVILDEATSSVDPESEQVIQKAIDVLLAGRSVVVIAHRLSTIRKCNRILVIQRGRVVEQGTHDELLQKNGAYAQLSAAGGL